MEAKDKPILGVIPVEPKDPAEAIRIMADFLQKQIADNHGNNKPEKDSSRK